MNNLEKFLFRDDGRTPNSGLPVLVYRKAFESGSGALAHEIEARFAENGWTGAWRASVYTFNHYHSTTHEVLGVFGGSATLRLGGEKGSLVRVAPGDVVVIPAGVGHQRLEATGDIQVVGAYPEGRAWDVLKGEPGDRPSADCRLSEVPLPENDPVLGGEGPLVSEWRAELSLVR